MEFWQMPLIALAAAYAFAAAAGWALTSMWGRAHAAWIAFPLLVALLFVPSDEIRGRALVAFLSVDLALKIIDYARELRQGRRWSWTDYLWLLLPVPVLLVRVRDRHWPAQPKWLRGMSLKSC
jgi:hypothetical protein